MNAGKNQCDERIKGCLIEVKPVDILVYLSGDGHATTQWCKNTRVRDPTFINSTQVLNKTRLEASSHLSLGYDKQGLILLDIHIYLLISHESCAEILLVEVSYILLQNFNYSIEF